MHTMAKRKVHCLAKSLLRRSMRLVSCKREVDAE